MFRPNLLVTLVSLLILAGCQTQGTGPTDPPPSASPTLVLSPASININAGDAPATFSAIVQNSSESVTWTFSGPGSVTLFSGPMTTYTPPEDVGSVQSGSLTATLGTTGVSATAAIVIYPADVTPPSEPPPPDPPTNPDPPTDPDPPSNPDPPTTPDMTVTIANVDPITVGKGGTVTVSLSASTSNAPSGTTYEWTAEGANSGNVIFSAATSEDTTATFSDDGSYTLRLSAGNGSRNATDTVTVTVNPAPPDVSGLWPGTLTDETTDTDYAMSLNLAQTGEDVTGTLAAPGGNFPMEGTFDGAELTLTTGGGGLPIDLEATVSGDDMSGAITTDPGDIYETTYTFTATRGP